MRFRTAAAVILTIVALAACSELVTCGGDSNGQRTSPLVVATHSGPDSRIDGPLLAALHRLASPTPTPLRVAAHQESAPTVEAAATHLPPLTVELPAVVEPCGPRIPTEHDVLRVTWATNYIDIPWAITPILELEWCESCRRDHTIGRNWEIGRFQYLRSTWESFQKEWMEERPDPPPVDPLDAWDATLMTAFAISQGHTSHWTCWGRW